VEEPEEEEEDEEKDEEEDEDLEEEMTNLVGRREHTSPICIDFRSRSKKAVVRSSGGPLFIAFEEARRRSVTLISTVGSLSIQQFMTNATKKPKSSLWVTSRVRHHQRRVSPREPQPSQRPRIKTLRIEHL